MSPYAATTSIVQYGDQNARSEQRLSFDEENHDANAAYQSFTSQHEIQTSYFKKSVDGSSMDGASSTKKNRKVKASEPTVSSQKSSALLKTAPRNKTKAKASQIAARKLAKQSVTERDITVFGLKTGKKSAKQVPPTRALY